MIKILILTDNIRKWYLYLLNMMDFDTTIQRTDYTELRNKMFCFHIRSTFSELMRGAAFAHVIEDKEIDVEDFYRLILPTIKQRVTQYGSRTILGER